MCSCCSGKCIKTALFLKKKTIFFNNLFLYFSLVHYICSLLGKEISLRVEILLLILGTSWLRLGYVLVMSSHLAISFTCYYFLPKILCSVFFLIFCRRDHFTHSPTLSIWCIEVLVFPLVLWLLQLLGQGLLFQHSLCLQMNLLFPLIGSMPTLGNLT